MRSAQNRQSESRSNGSALVLVLVVIAMLSLGAYTFSAMMITEYQAATTTTRQYQTRSFAQSGIEYVAAILMPEAGGREGNLYHSPELFHIPIAEGGGFTIVAPLEDAAASTGTMASGAPVRMGLIDESSKLNVNMLASMEDQEIARTMLLALPNMTEDVADAILDWIDSDTEPREFGAEAEAYSLVFPRDAPIDTLEELLLVAGVVPDYFYGEDANRNGILDPNENDADLSMPLDNGDGYLDLGWIDYLTVRSREGNLRRAVEFAGQPKINVNQELLTELYDALEVEFDADVARFICAYRLYGPVDEPFAESILDSNPLMGPSAAGEEATTGDEDTDAALEDAANALASGMFGGGSEDSVTRGGLDLSKAAEYEIRSLYELFGSQVQIEGESESENGESGGSDQSSGGGTGELLSSPWDDDAGTLQEMLPIVLDTLTVTDQTTITGRINVNQARREVLMAIPDMPLDLPDQIIAGRAAAMNMTEPGVYGTAGWLLIDGLVDIQTMRVLDGFITAQGDVFRVQSIGHSDLGGGTTRMEAMIDASEAVPKILMQRDLGTLGPGYGDGDLPQFSTATPTFPTTAAIQ